MTIARLRLGHRHLSLNIGLEPARQDQAAARGRLEARRQEQLALKAFEQRRNDWETSVLHLGRRPV